MGVKEVGSHLPTAAKKVGVARLVDLAADVAVGFHHDPAAVPLWGFQSNRVALVGQRHALRRGAPRE